MIIDTPDGPKFEWEVDEETLEAWRRATAAAAEAAEARQADRQRSKREEEAKRCQAAREAQEAERRAELAAEQEAREREAAAGMVIAEWHSAHSAPFLVALARRGEAEALRAWLEAGCDPDALVPEHKGSAEYVLCDDWTPLTAAAAAGQLGTVRVLLEYGADPNIVCCSSSRQGPCRTYTALDCARTGEALPFVLVVGGRAVPSGSDEEAELARAKHAPVERDLLAAGGRPAAVLSPPELSRCGWPVQPGQRQNPCLDKDGEPLRRVPESGESRPPPPLPPPPPPPSGPSAAAYAGDNPELRAALQKLEDRLKTCGTSLAARKRLMRALLLEWHPDKRPDAPDLAKQVFQWLQRVRWRTQE